MTNLTAFDQAFEHCPLVAILRGVKPDEVEEIGEVLVDRGIALIEVPLNSPQPFESIARLARRLSDRAVVGAGTVLTEDDVARVRDALLAEVGRPAGVECPPVEYLLEKNY